MGMVDLESRENVAVAPVSIQIIQCNEEGETYDSRPRMIAA